jgi:CRP-like cAMP-binding protein
MTQALTPLQGQKQTDPINKTGSGPDFALNRNAIFAQCTPRQLRRIEPLTTIVHVKPGRVLCRQGDIVREWFFILTGQAEVKVDDHSRQVGAADRVGELAPTKTKRRAATVTAITDLTIAVCTAAEFAGLLSVLPAVSDMIAGEATPPPAETAERGHETDSCHRGVVSLQALRTARSRLANLVSFMSPAASPPCLARSAPAEPRLQ